VTRQQVWQNAVKDVTRLLYSHSSRLVIAAFDGSQVAANQSSEQVVSFCDAAEKPLSRICDFSNLNL